MAAPTGAAATLLLAVARAVRSISLYDPAHAAVRQVLSEYAEKARAALDAHGTLSIEVHPFELRIDGELAYRDTDRERSLAFRLFRDGVRTIVVRPTATTPELLRFLELLVVRFTGLREQEEDALTLLRGAGFADISVDGIEGFTPDEENPEPELDPASGPDGGRSFLPPPSWDTPLPRLPRPRPIAWRAVPDEQLAELRGEHRDGEVTKLALSLARDLLDEVARESWSPEDAELTAFFAELRDGLIADGELASLRYVVDALAGRGGSALRAEILGSLGDARTLALVLASVPEDEAQPPPDLIPFLPLLGIDPILEQLSGPLPEGRRLLLSRIALSRLPREVDAILRRLRQLEARTACELARGIVDRAPERAKDVARWFLAQEAAPLRLEGLAILDAVQGDVPLRPVCDLLRDPAEPVRIRAAELLARRGDLAGFEPLRDALRARRVGAREAEALGRALALVAPDRAAALFTGWLEPRARFLRRLSTEQRTLQSAAIAGTGALPGIEPETTLQQLAERAGPEVRQQCLAALARRRRGTR